jgi:hypothetical protein
LEKNKGGIFIRSSYSLFHWRKIKVEFIFVLFILCLAGENQRRNLYSIEYKNEAVLKTPKTGIPLDWSKPISIIKPRI